MSNPPATPKKRKDKKSGTVKVNRKSRKLINAEEDISSIDTPELRSSRVSRKNTLSDFSTNDDIRKSTSSDMRSKREERSDDSSITGLDESYDELLRIVNSEEGMEKAELDGLILKHVQMAKEFHRSKQRIKQLEYEVKLLKKEMLVLEGKKTSKLDADDLHEFVTVLDLPIIHQDSLDKRSNLAREILTTEGTYLTGLTMMVKNFLEPFRETFKGHSKMPENAESRIFLNIEVIYFITAQLFEELYSCMANWEETGGNLGEIFVNWSTKLFGPYKGFLRDYTKGLAYISELSEETYFKVFMTERESVLHKVLGSLQYKDLYVTPVQRIPRYLMLMTDIYRNTDPEHQDYENLGEAVKKLQDLANKVNESMHESESSQMFTELISRGKGFDSLIIKPQPIGVHTRVWRAGVDSIKRVHSFTQTHLKKNRKYKEFQIFNDVLVATEMVTPKAHHSSFYIPLTALWISRTLHSWRDLDFQKSFDESSAQEFDFYIRGPMDVWGVQFEEEKSAEKCFKLILANINMTEEEAKSGTRNSTFEYPWGKYTGEFYNGNFNGNGIFTDKNGTTFDGYWNYELGSGFGVITDAEESFESGWRFEEETVESVRDEYYFWDEIVLTRKDWQILIGAASSKQVLEDNESIINEGVSNDDLFWLSWGTVRIEKKSGDSRLVLAKVSEEFTIFGETAILPNVKSATASVVSDHYGVEVYKISLTFLMDLFKTQPGLATRFYRQMSLKLADRLSGNNSKDDKSETSEEKLDSPPVLPSLEKALSLQRTTSFERANSARPNDDSSSEEDKISPQEVFRLPLEQVHIMTITCNFSTGIGSKTGELFLFQEYVGFQSTVFGFTSKDLIEISGIMDIKIKKKKIKIKFLKKKKKETAVISELENPQDVADLITTLWETQTQEGQDRKSKTIRNSVKTMEDTGVGFEMNQEEKDRLIDGKVETVYEPGAVIIQQGEVQQAIYQILEGGCKINIENKGTVARLKTGDLFGEITFLKKGPATASVIADSKYGATIARIDGSYINSLFVQNPIMSGHFYSYLAQILAERINEREKRNVKHTRRKKRKERRHRHSEAIPDVTEESEQ